MVGVVVTVAVLLVLIVVWRVRLVRRRSHPSGAGQSMVSGLPWEDPYRAPTPGGPATTGQRTEPPAEAVIVELERDRLPHER